MSQKTESVINKLFMALSFQAEMKGLQEIKVADISATAGVHRATFYRYVENIHDLLERGTDLFLDKFFLDMEEVREEKPLDINNSENPFYLKKAFGQIERNRTIFKAFLTDNSSNYFQKNLRKRITDFVEQHRLIHINDSLRRKHYAAMIGASLCATIELMVTTEVSRDWLKDYYNFVKSVIFFVNRM